MQPIEPAGLNSSYQSQPANRAALSSAGSQQAQSQQSISQQTMSSQSVSITSSTSRTTMVQEQVGSMLESISPEMAQNNQYLKLLIAALILNALLNGDESASQSGQGSMKALEELAGGKNNSFYLAIETSTNTVQIQQMSSRLETAQAVQSISQYQSGEGQTGEAQSGGKMDVAG
jgi:hypothetical protein